MAFPRLDTDGATMGFDERLHDRQPEAAAALGVGIGLALSPRLPFVNDSVGDLGPTVGTVGYTLVRFWPFVGAAAARRRRRGRLRQSTKSTAASAGHLNQVDRMPT